MGGARHIFFAGRRSHAGGQPPRGVVPVYGPSAEPEVVTPSAAAAAVWSPRGARAHRHARCRARPWRCRTPSAGRLPGGGAPQAALPAPHAAGHDAAAAAAADRGRLLSKAATSRAVVVAAAAETATAVEGDSRASRRAAAAALPLPARLPFLSGAAPLASRVAQ